MRDSDRSRCWGDTSCQPRGCADLIKARSLASVDPRQYHTKLARADSATSRGPYVGDDDTVFHLGDAWRDHVTRSTSRQGACFILSDADCRAKAHWSSARKFSPGSTKNGLPLRESIQSPAV